MKARTLIILSLCLVIGFCLLATSPFVRDLLLVYGTIGYVIIFAVAVFLLCMLVGMGFMVVRMTPNPPEPESKSSISSLKDCVTQCEDYTKTHKSSSFKQIVIELIEQSNRMLKKTISLQSIIETKFGEGGLTHHSYQNTLDKMETLFIRGIEEALLQIEMFDEDDYRNSNMRLKKEKDIIYQDVRGFIESVASNGELILVKYDQLALQLSKLGTISDDEFLDLLNQVGVDELITNTKQYDRSDFNV